MRCKYCEGLTVDELLKHGREIPEEYDPYDQRLAYKHQPSLQDLESSALSGCELCAVFYDGFRKRFEEFNTVSWDSRSFTGSVYIYTTLSCYDTLLIYKTRGWCDGLVLRTENRYADKCAETKFDMFIPNESTTVRSHILGRDVDPNPTSSQTLDKLREWIRNCATNHTGKCQSVTAKQLPTRVINIGARGGQTIPFLYETQSEIGHYAVLSHCWGGVSDFVTTKESLNQRKRGFTLDELPRNFQDAIFIARNLGLQYLWIDSICIIQGDADDWRREAGKMASVYKNSTISIAAADAATSRDGFLHRRPSSTLCTLHSGKKQNHSAKLRRALDTFEVVAEDSVLVSRGWTLQEEKLAPRIIWFGKHQNYWQCYCAKISEGTCGDFHYNEWRKLLDSSRHSFYIPHHMDPPLKALPTITDRCNGIGTSRPYYYPWNIDHRPYSSGPLGAVAHWLKKLNNSSRPLEDREQWERWRLIISNYVKRHLTNSEDRLPAIAGLAREFSAKAKYPLGGYMAGLWESHIHQLYSLLWVAPEHDHEEELHEHRYIPSWSWARICTNVDFDGVGRWNMEETSPNDATVLNVEIQTSGDPYMTITGGRLTIRGFCGYIPTQSHVLKIKFDTPKLAKRFLSRTRSSLRQSKHMEQNLLFCIQILDPIENGRNFALALQQVNAQKDTYERVGIVSLPYLLYDSDKCEWSKIRDSFEKQTISII